MADQVVSASRRFVRPEPTAQADLADMREANEFDQKAARARGHTLRQI